MKHLKLFVLFFYAAIAFGLHAQTLNENAWITNGSILSMVRSGNTTYLGGNFTMVGPYTGGASLINEFNSLADLSFPRVEGAVFAVASDGNGGWYIGGQFMSVGGQFRQNLAHILSDNTVDPVWAPNPDLVVNALAVSGNLLYVGGDFNTIGGQPRNYLAAIDQNGQPTAWDPNANASVNAIAVKGSIVIAGGDFATIGGQNRSFIASLDANGQATAWNPNADLPVNTLAISGDIVYAGGDFGNIGGGARNHIAALDTNGQATVWNPGTNQSVNSIIISSGIVYIGGYFTILGGMPRNFVGAVTEEGSLTTWNPNSNEEVNSLAISGNTIYIGGDFTKMGGGIPRFYSASVDLNGQLTQWHPGTNSPVNAIAAYGGNICAGGFFTSVNGRLRNYIAAFDENGIATPWNPNANGPVKALTVMNGIVYAGGAFTAIGGQSRNNIAALDENGLATAWNPNVQGGGEMKGIDALAASGNVIYAGGTFTNIGGQNRNNIAALNLNGQATSWNPGAGGTFINSINAMAVANNLVYVGGNFSNIGGKLRNNIAAIDFNGQVTDWNPNANGNLINTVNSLAVDEKTTYAGGFFSAIGGQPRNYVGAVDENGIATAWNPDVSGNTIKNVKTIVPLGNTILVGGNFTVIGGENRNYIAAVNENGQATSWNPNPGLPVNTMLVHNNQVYTGGEFFSIANHVRPYFAMISLPEGIQMKIMAASGENGTVSPANLTYVNYNEAQTYTMTPVTGYHVAEVLVDGQPVGPVGAYTFNNVTENHKISAAFAINVYSITASSGENGTVTPAGITNINYGGSQTYTITPDIGHHIVNVLVDGIPVGPVGSYTFNNIDSDHTISATFAINVYSITASSGQNGTVTPAGITNINYGGNQVYAITPNTGYHVVDVVADGVSQGAIGSYTFNNVTENHTISAVFAIDVFTITAASGEHGTVTPDGVSNVNYGDSLRYTITPETGYHIIDVVVDGHSVGTVSSYIFTNVTSNHTISAIFTTNVYSIVASSGGNGTVTPDGLTYVSHSGNQAYTITPAAGYHVSDVLVDGVSQGAITAYTFSNVNANHTISASFATDVFTITASSNENGTLLPAGVTNVNYGGSQSYSITPSEGYRIHDVIIDGSSQGVITTYTFNNVTSNHTISVMFVKNVYIITAAAGDNGTISPSGSVSVNYNENRTFNIAPSTGFHINDVVVDGVSQGVITTYTFNNVTTDHTITASFAIDLFTIVSSTNGTGSVTPAGASSVTFGGSKTYTFYPNNGYHIADVLVDGVSVGAVSSYTFTNITTSHTIKPIFAIDVFTISAKCGPGGEISPEGDKFVKFNNSLSFTINPKKGYHIVNVLIDAEFVGPVSSYTFSNVDRDHSIYVTFAMDVFTITASAGEHGKVSPAGPTSINSGKSQSYSITPDPGYFISSVMVDGEHIGRVESYTFSDVTANHTITAEFQLQPPAAPVLSTPAHNALGLPLGFTLTWKNVPFADVYKLQVATDSSFTKLVVDDSTITTSSKPVAGLKNSVKYFWRVIAKNAAGSGAFSKAWEFTTIMALPEKPELVSPADISKNQPTSLTLSWKNTKGAELYVLMLSADSLFTNELRTLIIKPDAFQDIMSFKVTNLANNKKYYWKVNAENLAGSGPFSSVWNFRTIVPVPGSPLLASPGNNIKDLKANAAVSWRKANYAEKYILSIAEDSQFKNIILSDTEVTDTLRELRSLKQGTRYFWKVEAKNIAGLSHSPEIWSFVTELKAPDSLVVNVLSKNKIKLTWKDKSNNAGRFVVERKMNNDFIILDTLISGTTSFIDSMVTVSMSYQYRIKAFTNEVSSAYSNMSGAAVTGVSLTGSIPKEYALMQNYPNPFNPVTTIRYGLPAESNVKIEIYNTLGEKVTELFNNIQRPGYYEIFFEGSNFSSGIYYCLLYARATDGSTQYKDVKKMVLLK